MTPGERDNPAWTWLFVAWLITAVATTGSLFFSEVMRLPPCTLCWYQRICMYPLAVILAVAVITRDCRVFRYALPLVIGGLTIAVYHNLLYYHVIPDSITPCTTQVSCTERQLEWFGFVTIPLLSLVGFTATAGALAMFYNRLKGSAR